MPAQRINRPTWVFASATVCTFLVSHSPAQELEWIKPSLSGLPEARCCGPAVYDSELHATVLFGGATYTTIFDDTWVFSKTSGWKQLAPPVSPPPLTDPGMAYDPITKTVVLFGGTTSLDGTGNTSSNETWTFDGVTWTQQFPPVSPSPRSWNTNGMVFDRRVGKVVLFGGYSYDEGVFTFTNDTWEWDGTSKTWKEKFPAHSPSTRSATLAYDKTSDQVVLFGGNSTPFALYGDTWTYDGVDWTQQQPTTMPPARTDNALVFDPDLGKVVMFGGLAGPCEDCGEPRLNDTWLWDGSNWAQEQTSLSPSARSGSAFDYDETVNGMLLFGGWISSTAFTSSNWFLGSVKP